MTKKIKSQINDSGVLMQPDFHDGLLLGFNLRKNKTVELILADVQGNEFTITLTDVLKIKADEFRESNIVFDIGLFAIKECSTEILEKLYNLETKSFVQKIKSIKENEHYQVIVITPSFGCSLIALFHEMKVSTERLTS
jgi:hypothetical protein